MSSELKNLADANEIERFSTSVQDRLEGRVDEERFKALRLQHGIYGQRQEGVQMVRVKIPGGQLNPQRLRALADVTEKYAEIDHCHITTRQDVQVHFVPLRHVPATMRRLLETGLTTREACGNTIRNVTSCALSGVCPREHTDINKHMDGAVEHFLRNPLNQQMPRKFKISFSACESDCAQSMIHDMGIIAVKKGDKFGFKVVAAGGLGHKPHEAITVEEFIEEHELLYVMEAVVSMHNKYSDRVKRAKARIKFLVDRFGVDGFLAKYREELARSREALATKPYPKAPWSAGSTTVEAPGPGAPRKVYAQKQQNLNVFPIAIPLGQMTAAQLRGAADLLDANGLSDIRTTQDQNLIVVGVPNEKVAVLRAGLAKFDMKEPQAGDNVVACPGTSTCRLGITSSMEIGAKLNGGKHDLRVRASGCHNGCAQPESGDIGIFGEGKRMHGKLIPHYQLYLGGSGMGGGGIGLHGPSIPTARIETAIERVKTAYDQSRNGDETFFAWTRRQGVDYFNTLLADLTKVEATDLAAVLRDHGFDTDFKVLQLGGGECAGASQTKIGSNFFDAAHERQYRDALRFQTKFADAIGCAQSIARLVGQAVVQVLNVKKPDDLNELAQEIVAASPDTKTIGEKLAQIAQKLAKPATDYVDADLGKVFEELDLWTLETAAFCQRLDKQLEIAEALPMARQASQAVEQRVPAGAA
jgi:sulfite reductase (ferredoxin)